MDIHRSQIADEAYFTLIKTEQFKAGLISVRFLAPLDKATAAENALFPQVLLRGCNKYPNMTAIARRKKSVYDTGLGATVYNIGENQVFGFNLDVLENKYSIDGMDIAGEATGLLVDILTDPVTENGVFKAEYVESEKKRLIDKINSQKNNKNAYAVMRCTDEMCRDERYGISEIGTVETVAAATPESVYAAYRRALKSARVEIVAVGNFDNSTEERFAAAFSKIEREPQPICETEIIRAPKGEVRRYTEIQKIQQGKLVIGFRTGSVISDGDYAATSLAVEIYGGSPISKLFMNVREKMSLCYFCSASADGTKGIMTVRSGIDFSKYEAAKAEIYRQLDLMAKGEITDEEFTGAKKSLINALREQSDDPAAIRSWYLGRLLSGRMQTKEEYIAEIERVTKEQVTAKAAGFKPDLEYFLKGEGKYE